jgi:hypothetical protein
VSASSCRPDPTSAQKRERPGGKRKTSPCTNFHPLSSPSSGSSSSAEYLTKSFLSTRMRMVARKPVSRRTVTQELMMENQWISRCCLRNWYLRYLSMRRSKGTAVGFQATE